MFKSILLPTDGSPLSDKALATAIEFAQLTGGKITAICVIQPAPFNAITDVGVVRTPPVTLMKCDCRPKNM